MIVLLETVTPPEKGLLNVEVKLTANIQITPTIARRRVSLFVSHHIADLLHGEMPDNLVWRESGAYWRVPVTLSSPAKGRIGTVGAIDVHVETGDLTITDIIISQIEQEAQRLAENASL